MKPVLTEEGKERVNQFINELTALQKEVLDAEKDILGDAEIPTEEDILQDILFFDNDFEEGRYYPATENWGLWLFLTVEKDYKWVEYKKRGESK